jgi:hypothetical protein
MNDDISERNKQYLAGLKKAEEDEKRHKEIRRIVEEVNRVEREKAKSLALAEGREWYEVSEVEEVDAAAAEERKAAKTRC